MSLFSETLGNGPDIVLLHGWGLHGGVWEETAAHLANDFRVTCIDLPGHGRSAAIPESYTLQTLAKWILSVAPQQAIWLGWSLGGMLAMQCAATHPERVTKLILVASTPRFTHSADWSHGISSEVFEQIAQELEHDAKKTIRRFLALQLRGSERAHESLTALNHAVFRHGLPATAALRGGLNILRDADLRTHLARISSPALVIAGERDPLIPLQAGDYLAENLPNGKLLTLPKSGHAPFLSHPSEFLRAINEFL
ncbi:MAG TPA: pimeloyl-ACP methyl ester esterase BioH [Gammaproteobacteria bacterium]|nr:pimeloyl-ACP methyl ester esterase BioH [Gammaproteobacteria bacterium]